MLKRFLKGYNAIIFQKNLSFETVKIEIVFFQSVKIMITFKGYKPHD